MAKYRMSAKVIITIAIDGKVRFSPEFQETICKTVDQCVADHANVSLVRVVELDEVRVRFEVTCKNYYSGIQEFTIDLRKRMDMLTKHGRDADLLEDVFTRYPELKGHSRAAELVGAFDNMAAKIRELQNDTRAIPPKPTSELPVPPSTGPRKTKTELKQHREQALRGQAPGQKREMPGTASTGGMNSIIKVPRSNAGQVFQDEKKSGA